MAKGPKEPKSRLNETDSKKTVMVEKGSEKKKVRKMDPKKKIKYNRFFLKKFKLNANIREYNAGSVISLECNKKTGIPKEAYWRKRLRDSEIDNCMEEVKTLPKKDKEKDKKKIEGIDTNDI